MTKEQFIEFVGQEQVPLRRFLCALCGGDSSTADDLAQEALLKAYMSFERFEGRARFSTWLFRIACNCFYDWKKSASRRMAGPGSVRTEKPFGFGDTVGQPGCGPSASGNAGYDDRSATVMQETCSDEEADSRFRYQQLYMAIDSLSDREKTVVLLFYMEDKSIKEITDITGMTSVTVRSHLFRARAHLMAFLKRRDL